MIARFTLSHADLITCDAQTVKSRLLEFAPRNPNDITVFPWGIDLSLFRPDRARRIETRRQLDLDDDAEVIISTRWLAPLYGVDDLLRALRPVFSARPKAIALIAGDGPQRAELELLARSLGIEHRVKFLGAIANSDLPAYLNGADLYVSASHSDGTSLSLLEAMGCGLPLVVTDIDSIREWVVENENGLIAPIGDPEKLAAALGNAFSDSTMMKLASANNLQQAIVRADWGLNFSRLEVIYHQLMISRL
jgi:glycosyltransferase involved in cell wall biosynthesis